MVGGKRVGVFPSMDSLVANYASSEEEEEKSENDSIGSLIPPPKTRSLFSSLPQPKKPNTSEPKRVVQFKPPPSINFDDDEDEEDIKEPKQVVELQPSSSSVKSFLSSIPAPRNSSTLGVAPTGSGRRSIVETEPTHAEPLPEPPVYSSNEGNYDSGSYDTGVYESGVHGSNEGYESGVHGNNEGNYDSGVYESGVYEGSYDSAVHSSNSGSYANYGSYDGGSFNGQQGSSNWGEGFRSRGKRGRNEIPTEIVEVKQDELMKDRPREDQVKLTGIAFGPSYQPVSNKGKPTKLHKRKHQIGSLYFDMKQKEMELQERRAKGFLTKAETHAKYGW